MRMFVALVIQHAMRMHHIVIGGLSGPTKVFHIISKTARFKQKNIVRKICGLIFLHPLRNI